MRDLSNRRANILALVILAFGLSAMVGELLNMSTLKGVGLASCASPYTKVFSQATASDNGAPFETFAASFILHYTASDGVAHELNITPDLYQKLKGPYQRRNVYGAILAYGPALSKNVQQRTFDYAINSPGYLRKELNIPESASRIRVEMISQTEGSNHSWLLHGVSNENEF